MANQKIDMNHEIEGVPVKDLVVRQLLTKDWINRVRFMVDLPPIELKDMVMVTDHYRYPSGDAIEVHLGVSIYCTDPEDDDYTVDELVLVEDHPLGRKTVEKIYAIMEQIEIPEFVKVFSYDCSDGLYQWLSAPYTQSEDTLTEATPEVPTNFSRYRVTR